MPTCRQMAKMAAGRAEGTLGPLRRLAFDRHLARCGPCRTYARQMEATRQALGRLPEPEISPALNEALLARFDTWAATRGAAPEPRRAPRFAPWPLLAAAAMLLLLVAFARQRSQAPDDWWIGSLLAAAALAAAAVAGRFAVGVVVAAVSAAVAAAFAGGRSLAIQPGFSVDCLALELATAAVVGGVAWIAARGGPAAFARRSLAGGALAGALVADAALQVTCGARDALPHLLVFHAGGVAVVAALAWAWCRRSSAARAP